MTGGKLVRAAGDLSCRDGERLPPFAQIVERSSHRNAVSLHPSGLHILISWYRHCAERVVSDRTKTETGPAEGMGRLLRAVNGIISERMSFGSGNNLLNRTSRAAFG